MEGRGEAVAPPGSLKKYPWNRSIMNYSLVLYPDKKKTPTLIHVQTFNTKKVGKKNLLPRIKSYHFCTKFTILISFILPPRLHPFHHSFFSQPLFSVYYSQHFSCEVMLWILQILQIDVLPIIKKFIQTFIYYIV